MVRANLAATLDQRHNGFLRRRVVVSPVLCLAADVSFIGLDELAIAAHTARQFAFAHRLAKPMAHEPCRFETHAERAMQLMAANAFLAAAHEERALKPDMQPDVAL